MQPGGIFVGPRDKDPYELSSPWKLQESKCCQFEPLNVYKLPRSNGNLINFPNTFTSELILKQFSLRIEFYLCVFSFLITLPLTYDFLFYEFI